MYIILLIACFLLGYNMVDYVDWLIDYVEDTWRNRKK